MHFIRTRCATVPRATPLGSELLPHQGEPTRSHMPTEWEVSKLYNFVCDIYEIVFRKVVERTKRRTSPIWRSTRRVVKEGHRRNAS